MLLGNVRWMYSTGSRDLKVEIEVPQCLHSRNKPNRHFRVPIVAEHQRIIPRIDNQADEMEVSGIREPERYAPETFGIDRSHTRSPPQHMHHIFEIGNTVEISRHPRPQHVQEFSVNLSADKQQCRRAWYTCSNRIESVLAVGIVTRLHSP